MGEGAMSRRMAVALGATLLAAPLVVGAAARYAAADVSLGGCTVSGVAGVDEAVFFPTFAEAVGAIAASEPAGQLSDSADAPVATVIVHGEAVLDNYCYELLHPVDGAVMAILGADASSSLVVADGGALQLVCPAGSLVIRGVELRGPVSLQARDDLVVDSCSCTRGISCAAGGSVCMAGNVLRGTGPDGEAAFDVDLTGSDAVLTITGNDVSGFPCCADVWCGSAQGGAEVRMTSNFLALDPAWSDAGPKAAVLRFAGGPWGPGSIVRDNNVVENASELLMLDGSFCASVSADAEFAGGDWDSENGRFVQSVAHDNLVAPTLVSLFELTGCGSSSLPDGLMAVAVDPAVDAPSSREQAREASSVVLPASLAAPEGEAFCSVSYDANGAYGVAPDSVAVELGASVSVATMGSLVAPGFVFAGWNTKEDGSGLFYASGQVFVPQHDTVLYAQWSSTGTIATVSVGTAESGV